MPIYETSYEAEQDLQGIIDYTLEMHGIDQMNKYINALDQCAENMAQSIGQFKEVDVLGDSVRVKLCQHHYIFGLMRNSQPFLILAILHERMDLMNQLKNRLS